MKKELTIIAGKISVVIPLYNKERYVERCLRSVINQTCAPLEIIVIDDGSTDSSKDVVSRFDSDNIRLISQRNSGCSAARNTGINSANGQFIAFLDADDEWMPTFLEAISDLIQSIPEASVFATSYLLKSDDSQRTPKFKNLPDLYIGLVEDYFEASLLDWSLLSSSTTVVNKEFLLQCGGFNPGLSLGEDTELWCRLALNGKIAFSNRPLAIYYYQNETSVSNKEISRDELFYSKYLSELLKTGNIPKHLIKSVKRFVAKGLQYLVCEHSKRGNYGILIKMLKDPRIYAYFGSSTLKMWFAVFVPVRVYEFVKQHSRFGRN